MTEIRLQFECFTWFWNYAPAWRRFLFHVPNELAPHPNEPRREYVRRVSQAKAAGVVKGVPDLILMRPVGPVGFELKTKTGRVSDDQKRIRALWAEKGINVHEIRDLQTFQNIIKNIMADDIQLQNEHKNKALVHRILTETEAMSPERAHAHGAALLQAHYAEMHEQLRRLEQQLRDVKRSHVPAQKTMF